MNGAWLLLALAGAAPAGAAFERESAAARAYLEGEFKARRFAGSALVAREGKVLLRASWGAANAEHNVPNTPETKFRIGSITKQFTALAIMQLRERGQLRVEDTLDKYFTPCPEPWKKVTLHHLLTHTSGIPSYTSDKELMKRNALHLSLDELFATFRDKPLEFEPGSRYVYDNSGYALLGAVIEKVSGLSYEEYLRQNIFTPAGMKNTGYDRFESILPNRASGYVSEGGEMKHAPYMSMSLPYAAGALYSTVDDLRLWDEALAGDKLLPQASAAKMYAPFLNEYGYGWVIGEKGGRRMISHGGGINGFNSTIVRFPAERTLVVALSNLATPHMGRIGSDLAAIAFGGQAEPRERAEKKVDPKVYDAYVGDYELTPKFHIRITREDGPGGPKLMAQATGQQKFELFAESETKFFYKVVDARITFDKDKLTLHQNGQDMPARRVSTAPPKERVAKKVDPKLFDNYIGQYQIAPNVLMWITRENGPEGARLMAQVSGQGKTAIFAESETEFFYKEVDAQITFGKDSLTLHQNGRDIQAPRVSKDPPKERVAIAADPKRFAAYTGVYELAPGFTITVRLEGEKLMAQATGQPAFEIFPESEVEFFYKVVDATITFSKDRLVLHQGGRDLPGKKIE